MYRYFACGDGEFVWDSTVSDVFCYNYRTKMFFCEYQYVRADSAMRTLQNGHCVNQGWIEKNFTDMNESEKCTFFLKCNLTNGKNDGCNEALRKFRSICKDKHIKYPSGSFFKTYFQTVYILNESKLLSQSVYTYVNGSIKCIGYQARTNGSTIVLNKIPHENDIRFDTLICSGAEQIDTFGPQFDKHCWNETKQSFSCIISQRCISKYRVLDGYKDCNAAEDELATQEDRTKQAHRFYCPNEASVSLLVSAIGSKHSQCTSGADEYLPQLSWNLADHKCTRSNPKECKVLRAYIQSSLPILVAENSKILIFRQYCDTIWQLSKGFDETLCNEWECPKDEYQCLTGHCIPVSYVTDQVKHPDWQCPDASDKIALFRITQLSKHNGRLINQYKLQALKNYYSDPANIKERVLFSTICNLTNEYGCILVTVNDPLNFTLNRPCINLTQIGDGNIDCYGGLDERNLLTCGNNTLQQRGFDFHCSEEECIPYHRHCEQRCSNYADSLLCDQLPSLAYPYCLNHTRLEMCRSRSSECPTVTTYGYYCDRSRDSK
jgi:hypothetical protein